MAAKETSSSFVPAWVAKREISLALAAGTLVRGPPAKFTVSSGMLEAANLAMGSMPTAWLLAEVELFEVVAAKLPAEVIEPGCSCLAGCVNTFLVRRFLTRPKATVSVLRSFFSAGFSSPD